MTLTKEEVALLFKVISVLYDWSGVTNDTPDDTEIISSGQDTITLADLRDASVALSRLK